MIGKSIAILFLSRDVAHRAHLGSKSYAEHMALGGFYDTIVDQADALAEAWQGTHGLIKDIPYLEPDKGDVVSTLEKQMTMFCTSARKAVGSEGALENIIDSIEETYLSTLYKLKFLK